MAKLFADRLVLASGIGSTSAHAMMRNNGTDVGTSGDGAGSIDDIAEWLGEVNSGYTGSPFSPRSSNCGSCALAVHQRLSGADQTAAASLSTLSTDEMAKALGGRQVLSSPAGIEDALRDAGPGSHAIIGVDRDGAPGHWFNAYFDGSTVHWIDGQNATHGPWPPDPSFANHPVTVWDYGGLT